MLEKTKNGAYGAELPEAMPQLSKAKLFFYAQSNYYP